MAMDFFAHQERARGQTRWLIGLFILSVGAIILSIHLLIGGLAIWAESADPSAVQWLTNPLLFVAVTVVIGGIIALGSLYKSVELQGGAQVARSIGGRLLSAHPTSLAEIRVRNVVEEMAIASGMPVPPIYILEERSINAFAAGYSPRDAVVGVTRGCIEQLSREELQGVIAHEFSHIFNGDMKLNMRLMGLVFGILVIGICGRILFELAARFGGRGGNNKKGDPTILLIALGAGLFAIGYLGFFLGGVIRSAISRQREYLADASAVQYTRNPDGIGSALRRLGGVGSAIKHPNASEASHMFFGTGVSGFMQAFATHPPLPDRVKRICPTWDGTWLPPRARDPEPEAAELARGGVMSNLATAERQSVNRSAGRQAPAGMAGFSSDPPFVEHPELLAPLHAAVQQVGQVSAAGLDQATQQLAQLPATLNQAAHETAGACAIVYGLLLNPPGEVRERQWNLLQRQADPATVYVLQSFQQQMDALERADRLSLALLAIPTLRQLSRSQYDRLRGAMRALIAADAEHSLFEWCLERLVEHHLDPQFGTRPPRRLALGSLPQLADPCSVLLGFLARAGNRELAGAQAAFASGWQVLGLPARPFPGREQMSPQAVSQALDHLSAAIPKLKRLVLHACATCILADREVTQTETELVRVVASVLDCPLPPLQIPAGGTEPSNGPPE